MVKTICFDLDGTLLPLDMKRFEPVYFNGLMKHFEGIIDGQQLVKIIWEATKAMITNKEHITNETVFMNHLKTLIEPDQLGLYQQKFQDFYLSDFDSLKAIIEPNELIQQSVKLLQNKGYSILLCTNPLFPQVAIHKRIEWAGFKPSDFSYVTTFENSHYCKPQIEYYQEVVNDNDLNASECLMVGNDPLEDMIAQKIGMQTYLITTHQVDREIALTPTFEGDYQAFYDFVQALPSLS